MKAMILIEYMLVSILATIISVGTQINPVVILLIELVKHNTVISLKFMKVNTNVISGRQEVQFGEST